MKSKVVCNCVSKDGYLYEHWVFPSGTHWVCEECCPPKLGEPFWNSCKVPGCRQFNITMMKRKLNHWPEQVKLIYGDWRPPELGGPR